MNHHRTSSLGENPVFIIFFTTFRYCPSFLRVAIYLLIVASVFGCGASSSDLVSAEIPANESSESMNPGFSEQNGDNPGQSITEQNIANEDGPLPGVVVDNPAAISPVFADMTTPESPIALQEIGSSSDCVGLNANGRQYCFGVTSRQLLIVNPQDASEQRIDLPRDIAGHKFQSAVAFLGTVFLVTGSSTDGSISAFHLNRFTETGEFINSTEFLRLGRNDRVLNPDGYRLAATVEQGFIIVAGRYRYVDQVPDTTGIFAALALLQNDLREQVGFSYQEFGLASAPARVEQDEQGISVNLNNQQWRLDLNSLHIPELLALNDAGSALTFQHRRLSEQLSVIIGLRSTQVLSEVRTALDQLRGFSIQTVLGESGASDTFNQLLDCPGGGSIAASQDTIASSTVWTAQATNCSINANIYRGEVTFDNDIQNNELYFQSQENITYNAFSVDFANGDTLFADCTSERFLKLLNEAGLQAEGDDFNPLSREVRNGYECEQLISIGQNGLQLSQASSQEFSNQGNSTENQSNSSLNIASITATLDEFDGATIRIETDLRTEVNNGVQRNSGSESVIADDGSQIRQVQLPGNPLPLVEVQSNGQTTASTL